ncbi:MAG: hypothetical protein HY828_09000 [Actinobacteria bacterium]|nr:hypothetical protein [Actinomycetota bacterium]
MDAVRPDVEPPAPDVTAIEAVMRRAIDERRPDLLRIIGNGELTIAIRWDDGESACVIKRVPPFPERRTADEYCGLVRQSIADMTSRGVACVATGLHTLDRADGSAVVYHCQPLLTPDRLADHLLRRTQPDAELPLVTAVVDHVVRVVGDGIPMDSQFANWYWFEERPWQLDLSTPLMMTPGGDICFDTTGFVREYPAFVRRIVYKELMKMAPGFADVEWVLTDLMVQLHRSGLDAWCASVATAARARHGIELSEVLAKERFEADAKFFPTLLRLKRLQRGWVQRTGRRYDTLLPATTSFGT